MSASFLMSGVVTLGDSHSEFSELLGLPAPSVLTVEQFHMLLWEAEGVLMLMELDPQSGPVVEFLSRHIIADLIQHSPGAVGRRACRFRQGLQGQLARPPSSRLQRR